LLSNIAALLFVCVGALFSLYFHFGRSTISEAFDVYFLQQKRNYDTDQDLFIGKCIRFALKFRRDGHLALEKEVDEMEHPLMKKGLRLVVDQAGEELTKTLLEIEKKIYETNEENIRYFFNRISYYLVNWGISAIIVAIILSIGSLRELKLVIPYLGFGIFSLYYALLFATLIFQPIEGWLERVEQYDRKNRELIINGIMGIYVGENPAILDEKLSVYLQNRHEVQLIAEQKKNEAEIVEASS
jgi:chemotaxis protein MotA